MEDGISVVICCYNSSLRLKPTLEHLWLQKNIQFTNWEVIVVDNASSDNTAEAAATIWNSFPGGKPAIKIVHEGKAGLSSARDRGIKEARHKFVLFCDDDNWLDDNYLSMALQIINSSSDFGALGGQGFPVFEEKEPPYFWENQYNVLAVGDQWHTEGDITKERGVLYGAGMVLNKAAYNTLIEKFNFKFQVSDRKGDNLISSGDHEICLALKRIGYKILYSKSLVFKHYIPKRRTSLTYYKNLFISFGKSYAMLSIYFVDRSTLNSIKNDYRYICLRCGKNMVKTWIKLLFTGYYTSSNKYKYINSLHHLYNNLGILQQTMTMRNSFKVAYKDNVLFNS
jgi:glycosyltransferase involved in cell wall biosynthesis